MAGLAARVRRGVGAGILGMGVVAVLSMGVWAANDGGAAGTRPAILPEVGEGGVPPVTTEARAEVTKLAAAPNDPKTVDDLKAIEARVEAVVKVAMPATVSIQFPYAQGSGVIVSKDGYVLTAGHVSGKPGQKMNIRLADGRTVKGKSLGANNGIDSGMIKITDEGEYPFVPVGSTLKLTAGQWVVAMGHPGGYVKDRPAVVRLGRVLVAGEQMIGTDSPLISGDSGGPLFDLDGRLIGINSRIGAVTTANIHVPIETFVKTWDRLAKGDEWGSMQPVFDWEPQRRMGAGLGIVGRDDEHGTKVISIHPRTAASKSLLREGDVITMMNGQPMATMEDLAEALSQRRAGEQVTLMVMRESKATQIPVTLGVAPRK